MAPGDTIRVELKSGKVFEGTELPHSSDVLALKLSSGYNMGIKQENIAACEVLREREVQETPQSEEIFQSKDLPKISILHTGGTIASKVDYETGGVIARFTPEELLALFPEIKNKAAIESRLIANMWSDDMRFAHYNSMAEQVQKEVAQGAQGIIITHGTDTLHYSAAALAFALENVPIPVILVGAQRSSDRGSSDAAENLLCAVSFITQSDFKGVAVCMHKTMDDDTCVILPATKCRKMHTSRRDTFVAVNGLAYADVTRDSVVPLSEYPDVNGSFVVKPFKADIKTALLKIHTNMYACQFDAFRDFEGIVLEGTGLGHAPISAANPESAEHKHIHASLLQLREAGVVLAMAPQSIYGRVDMNVYAPGRVLQEMGVLGNFCDMTPETAFIKLSWLLSNYSKEEAQKLYSHNMRGEISSASHVDGFVR